MKTTKLTELLEAIHKKDSNDIYSIEKEVAEEIEDSIASDSFFKLPLENIFSIVSKIDFLDVEDYSNLLKNIIKGTIKEHENDKDNLFLLYHIKAKGNKTVKLEECIEILQCFKNIELFSLLNDKYNEKNSTPEFDKDYEIIQQKEAEINELKKQLKRLQQNETLGKELEQNFPPIQKKPMFHEPDLFKAVIKGKLDSVQYLIEKQGVEINQQATKDDEKNNINKGETALHIALKNNQEKIAKYLLLKGAKSDIQNDLGKSAFIYGCENNNKTFIQSVLALDKITFSPDELCTSYPLHFACEKGHLPLVQYLLEKGANIEAKNKFEETPLHIACQYGQLPVVQYFIEKGVNIEEKDKDQQTPLHFACFNGSLPVVQYLIETGANMGAKDSESKTPLFYACENGHLPVVQYLISKGDKIETKGYLQKTPLHYASENGQLQIIKYFIERGTKIDRRDYEDKTLLHYASENGHLPLVQYLLEKGAKLEAQSKIKWTPLQYACKNGHLPVVQYLIAKGANIETKDSYKLTPLQTASMYGRTDVVNYLISKGANENTKESNCERIA